MFLLHAFTAKKNCKNYNIHTEMSPQKARVKMCVRVECVSMVVMTLVVCLSMHLPLPASANAYVTLHLHGSTCISKFTAAQPETTCSVTWSRAAM